MADEAGPAPDDVDGVLEPAPDDVDGVPEPAPDDVGLEGVGRGEEAEVCARALRRAAF